MPRDVSLSDSKCWNGGNEWVKSLPEIHVHHSSIVLGVLRGTLNWSPFFRDTLIFRTTSSLDLFLYQTWYFKIPIWYSILYATIFCVHFYTRQFYFIFHTRQFSYQFLFRINFLLWMIFCQRNILACKETQKINNIILCWVA